MEKSKEASVFGAYEKRVCVIASKLEMGQCHLPLLNPYSPEYFQLVAYR